MHCDSNISYLRQELERARLRQEAYVRMLLAIHALLYPPAVVDRDGRQWQYVSPTDPAAHLQDLSDRIRALPADLALLETDRAPGWSAVARKAVDLMTVVGAAPTEAQEQALECAVAALWPRG
jgi:hypothetical protein